MSEINIERLVEDVTRQVLSALQARQDAAEEAAGKDRCLVVGKLEDVPDALKRGAVLYGMEEYEGCKNILRFQRVIISGLTLVQLADIALGRPGDSGSCAVVSALLHGVEVVLLESALPHRSCAGKGSTGLYALLEGHVRTIQAFGVKLLAKERLAVPETAPVRPPKYQAPAPGPVKGSARPSVGRLISESDALAMAAASGGQPVRVAGDAILTPSAWDVFTRARVEVIRGDG